MTKASVAQGRAAGTGTRRARGTRSKPVATHGLTHIALAVASPARSLRFYRDQFAR